MNGQRHAYVITELDHTVERNNRVCMLDDCQERAHWRCQLDLLERSGATNSGYSTASLVCASHAVDWLKWSLQ